MAETTSCSSGNGGRCSCYGKMSLVRQFDVRDYDKSNEMSGSALGSHIIYVSLRKTIQERHI